MKTRVMGSALRESPRPAKEVSPAGGAPAAVVGRVLLAEDDEEFRRLLAAAIRKDGHVVIEIADGTCLLDTMANAYAGAGSLRDFDIVISDIRLPGLTGLYVLAEISSFEDLPPFIFITAFGDDATHRVARALGAIGVFDKPFEVDDLRWTVDEAIRQRRARREVDEEGAPRAERARGRDRWDIDLES